MEEMQSVKDETAKFFKKNYSKIIDLRNQLSKEYNLDVNSVKASDLIKALKKLPKGARVTIKQSGYYAEGDYVCPYIELKEEKNNVYILGESDQNY